MNAKKWTATLEQALLLELQHTWVRLNQSLFRDALRQPGLQLHGGRKQLGHWHGLTRTLSLSRPWILDAQWGQVIEVLKHEMAHQYVSEVLNIHDETPHGPAFQSVCQRFHIDHRAVGIPRGNSRDEPKAVSRIRKLLALSQSPNEFEAQTALAKARRLMTEHELEWSHRLEEKTFDFRHLGPAKGRFDPWEKCLAGLLGKHFFVHPIWVPVYDVFRAKTVRTLEINGRVDALEVAEYAHRFLSHTGQRLWQHHKTTHNITSNKDRRVFLLGVMLGFSERLEQEQRTCHALGLVVARDAQLQVWFRQRHRWIRNRRGGSVMQTATLAAGQRAGRSIDMRTAITKRRGLLTRLLGG